MRGIGFVIAIVVGLAFFTIPLTGCLSLALAILGIDPEIAVPACLVLVVVYIVWTGVKVFFLKG